MVDAQQAIYVVKLQDFHRHSLRYRSNYQYVYCHVHLGGADDHRHKDRHALLNQWLPALQSTSLPRVRIGE